MLKYTKEHEWLKPDGDHFIVGITEHATVQLGDLVFVELPEAGTSFDKDAHAATVESVKAASEVYAPVACEIVAVNEAIVEDPSIVNADPLGNGWFFKINPTAPGELEALLDEAAYKALVAEA